MKNHFFSYYFDELNSGNDSSPVHSNLNYIISIRRKKRKDKTLFISGFGHHLSSQGGVPWGVHQPFGAKNDIMYYILIIKSRRKRR
jgi:hypothetical protein